MKTEQISNTTKMSLTLFLKFLLCHYIPTTFQICTTISIDTEGKHSRQITTGVSKTLRNICDEAFLRNQSTSKGSIIDTWQGFKYISKEFLFIVYLEI